MSFGFGIGDVILACQSVVTVYTRCKNAPMEISNVASDVKRMEITLGLLGRVVVDEVLFVQKHGEDIVSMITDEIPPLKRDIKKIKRLIKRWNSISHTQAPLLARGKFIAWDLGTVKDLRSKLEGYRIRLVYGLQMINLSDGAAQSAQDQAETRTKVLERTIENKDRKLRDAKEEQHRMQTQATQEQIYKMLEKIDKKEPNSVLTVARSGNAVSVAALEKTLVDSGLLAKDLKAPLEYLMTVLRRDQSAQPTSNIPRINVQDVPDNPSPGNSSLVRHHSDAGSKTKGISPAPGSNNSRPLSSSNFPAIGPPGWNLPRRISLNVDNTSPYTPTKLPVRNTPVRNSEGKKILCIDGSNGVRSILATTYLEVMRVWTANTTNRWLFKRVSSTGLNVSTDYTKANLSTLNLHDPSQLFAPGTHPDLRITPSLLAPPSYAWADGFPNETISIAKRIESLPSNGLLEWYFDSFDYILCFNAAGGKSLNKLLDTHNLLLTSKGNPPSGLQVQFLQGCDLFGGPECLDDPMKMNKTAAAIKTAIKQFLTTEFAWEIDVCAQQPERLRTLQVLMKTSEMRHFATKCPHGRNIVEDTGKTSKWTEITECTFWIAFEKSGENGEAVWLVSIVGKEGKLAQAEALVRGTRI